MKLKETSVLIDRSSTGINWSLIFIFLILSDDISDKLNNLNKSLDKSIYMFDVLYLEPIFDL